MVLDINQLKIKRRTIKATASRYKRQIEALSSASTTLAEIEERRDKYAQLWDQYDDIQGQIEMLQLQDPGTPEQLDALHALIDEERDGFETAYHSFISWVNSIINRLKTAEARTNSQRSTPVDSNIAEAKIKLRSMDVPTFAGSFDTWRSFRDSFRSLVHDNSSLTKVQKFHHLSAALVGEAVDVLHSLEICGDNYDQAWEMLNKRFNNERWIIEGHLNALFNLPVIKNDTPQALRQLHDSVIKNLRALNSLKQTTDYSGDMVVHLMISKFDANTYESWFMKRVSKEFPTLDEVTEFLLEHAQDLETRQRQFGKLSVKADSQPRNQKTKTASSHLVATKSTCPKCKGPHLAFECAAFRDLSAEDRFRLIRGSQLCTNCLRTNKHSSRACKGGALSKVWEGTSHLAPF